MRVVQRVERVKELFLRTLFSGNELNVIDQQDIVVSISLFETEHLVVPNSIDDFVGKFLRRDIGQAKQLVIELDRVSDGVHEMCLAKTHATIKEQGIVCL